MVLNLSQTGGQSTIGISDETSSVHIKVAGAIVTKSKTHHV